MHHERAGASGDRRANRGVLQLNLRVFDGGAVGADDGIERRGRRARRVALLARADAALDEVVHSLRDDFGVRRLRRVARQVRFGLIQRGFERPMVEREQHLSGLHIVALLEVDGLQLAGHLGSHGDGRKRLDGADDVHVERHFLLDDPVDGDGNCGLRRAWRSGPARRSPNRPGALTLIPTNRHDKQAMDWMHGESCILAIPGPD